MESSFTTEQAKREEGKTYRITVIDIGRNVPLTFKGVLSYAVEDSLLRFTDIRTGRVMRFPVMTSQIEEELP